MGWSGVKIAMRYIHPSEDHVLAAIEGLQQTEMTASGSNSSSNSCETSLPLLATGTPTTSQ